MKCADIIKQLIENVPKHTDLFSSSFNPDAVSVAGGVVTVTKTAHGLQNNKYISVTGGQIVTSVSNIDDSGDNVVFTTATNHDLTGGEWLESVNITSASTPAVDGDYDLVTVPNRQTFTLASFPDTGVTDLKLNENRSVGVDGLYKITLIDTDNFSFQLADDIGSVTIKPETMEVQNKVRISGAVSLQRARKSYEQKQDEELWLFVVLGDNDINKDRYVNTDSEMEQGGLNEWNGILLSPFHVYCFIPSQNSISGRISRDLAEDVRPILYSSLLGKAFGTGFTNQAVGNVFPVGDGSEAYAGAYYIHRFTFRQNAQISALDTLYISKNTAFRDVAFDYENTATDNGEVIMSTSVDLDDEPI